LLLRPSSDLSVGQAGASAQAMVARDIVGRVGWIEDIVSLFMQPLQLDSNSRNLAPYRSTVRADLYWDRVPRRAIADDGSSDC